MSAAPAPAQLQGQQGLESVIWALTEASGLKQLLVLIFLAISFCGIPSPAFRGICLSCRRIFPEGFAHTCREESRHKQILIKLFFQLPRLVQFNFFSEIILTLTSFFIIVSFACGIALARNPLEANAH